MTQQEFEQLTETISEEHWDRIKIVLENHPGIQSPGDIKQLYTVCGLGVFDALYPSAKVMDHKKNCMHYHQQRIDELSAELKEIRIQFTPDLSSI